MAKVSICSRVQAAGYRRPFWIIDLGPQKWAHLATLKTGKQRQHSHPFIDVRSAFGLPWGQKWVYIRSSFHHFWRKTQLGHTAIGPHFYGDSTASWFLGHPLQHCSGYWFTLDLYNVWRIWWKTILQHEAHALKPSVYYVMTLIQIQSAGQILPLLGNESWVTPSYCLILLPSLKLAAALFELN